MLVAASLAVAFSWLVLLGLAVSVGALHASRLQRRQASRSATRLRRLSGIFALDDAGASIDTADGAHHLYPWASFSRVATSSDHIFLMSSRETGWIVPKRCFGSREAADQFFAYALDHIGNASAAR